VGDGRLGIGKAGESVNKYSNDDYRFEHTVTPFGKYIMDEEYEVKMSPLCQEVSSGGETVKVEIYEDGHGGWILKVVDEHGNSTVWDDSFPTDTAALTEVKKTILKEGVQVLIGTGE
jgi:hypothetical protein